MANAPIYKGSNGQREAIGVFLVDDGDIGDSVQLIETRQENALRDGRFYAVTSGVVTVASGNTLAMYISNPKDSGRRVFTTTRLFTSTRTDCAVGSVMNPTQPNIIPTPQAPANLGVGNPSVIVSRSGALNASNLTTLQNSGTAGASYLCATGLLDLEIDRTIEPGGSFCNIMTNPSNGLNAGDMRACITYGFYEEAID